MTSSLKNGVPGNEIYLHSVSLRYDHLRHVYWRDASLRYAVWCDAFLCYGYFQNQLVAIYLWIDAFAISMILLQLLSRVLNFVIDISP